MNEITPVRLGNKYILLDLLGTGGMAEVFRGKLTGEKGFEKLIVIKQLLDHVGKDSELVEHFTSEARLAALLQHENIATIYDFGEAEGRYFMAMEYLFGKDLQTVIRKGSTDQTFKPEYALMIGLKICDAMGYAHSLTDLQGKPLKIIHRDLTPHNIFLTYEGKVKIIDFGIAKTELHDNKTRVGVVKGKITYMSPEQLAGDEIDFRSDIFSIGILLYEMLSGRRMYTGDTATLIRKAITVDYEKLETVRPGLDPALYDMLGKALTVSPDDRYQSCEEMQLDIEKCLARISRGYDHRLLRNVMLSLFGQEYQREKDHGIKALQAAREFEAGFTGNTEKTIFITPALPTGDKGNRSNSIEKRSGFMIKSSYLLAGIVALGSIFIIFLFFDRAAGPEKAVNAVSQEHTGEAVGDEQGGASILTSSAVSEPAYQNKQAVERLLQQAENALAVGNLSEPAETNAFYYYREIEKIDPGNHRAQDGFRRISDRYAELAEGRISQRRYAEAMRLVEKGIIVDPRSNRLTALQARLESERAALINELVERAEQRLAENMLTTPSDDCAFKYYREIEAIGADHGLVQEGFRKIGDRYALLADNAFRRLDFDGARHFVSEGIAVDPDNYRLQILERELLKSKPEMIMRGVEKNLKSFF